MPIQEAIRALERLLGEDDDDDLLYATMELEEAEAMGPVPAETWYAQGRPARALGIAKMIAQRRKNRYYALKRRWEYMQKHGK